MHGTVIVISLMTTVILLASLTFHYRNQRDKFRLRCNEWETEFTRLQGISQRFVSACRLIAIHRTGRVTHFTFMRGDDMWTIETIGMLSDDVPSWKKRAGIE